jgi:hypothetical protein
MCVNLTYTRSTCLVYTMWQVPPFITTLSKHHFLKSLIGLGSALSQGKFCTENPVDSLMIHIQKVTYSTEVTCTCILTSLYARKWNKSEEMGLHTSPLSPVLTCLHNQRARTQSKWASKFCRQMQNGKLGFRKMPEMIWWLNDWNINAQAKHLGTFPFLEQQV